MPVLRDTRRAVLAVHHMPAWAAALVSGEAEGGMRVWSDSDGWIDVDTVWDGRGALTDGEGWQQRHVPEEQRAKRPQDSLVVTQPETKKRPKCKCGRVCRRGRVRCDRCRAGGGWGLRAKAMRAA